MHGTEKAFVVLFFLIADELADALGLVHAATFQLDHGNGNAVDIQHDIRAALQPAAQGHFLGQCKVVVVGVRPVDEVHLADRLTQRGLHIGAVAQQVVGFQVGVVQGVAADFGGGLQLAQRSGNLHIGIAAPL